MTTLSRDYGLDAALTFNYSTEELELEVTDANRTKGRAAEIEEFVAGGRSLALEQVDLVVEHPEAHKHDKDAARNADFVEVRVDTLDSPQKMM